MKVFRHLAQCEIRQDRKGMRLVKQQGWKGEENCQKERKEDEKWGHPTSLPNRDDARVETVKLKIRFKMIFTVKERSYTKVHVVGERAGRVGFSTEKVERETGKIEHEESHEEMVSHGEDFAEQRHALGL